MPRRSLLNPATWGYRANQPSIWDPIPPYTPIPSGQGRPNYGDTGQTRFAPSGPQSRPRGLLGRHSAFPNQTPLPNAEERFKQRMIPHEGDRNDVYLDSLGKPTVGIGHKITPADRLAPGQRISDERKEQLWQVDSTRAATAARKQMVDAGLTNPDFFQALADVNFNVGPYWRSEFPVTWDLISKGRYQDAARELSTSKWSQQTPKRVRNFQDALMALEAVKR